MNVRQAAFESVEREVPWKSAQRGVVYRIQRDEGVTERLSISAAGRSYRYLRLRIYNGDDAPLDIAQQDIRLTRRPLKTLVFDVRPENRYRLFFGNPKASAPNYDLTRAVAGLGPEPLEDGFTAESFRRALLARRRVLKPLLLDQSFLAGLGNIYVDEALHRAGLHPLRRSDKLPKRATDRLHAEIRATLTEAIEREGSSFDAFYRTPEGQPGSYQHQFRVYGRAGQPCRTCGRPIRKLVVAQRGTHVCTHCQRAPRSV